MKTQRNACEVQVDYTQAPCTLAPASCSSCCCMIGRYEASSFSRSSYSSILHDRMLGVCLRITHHAPHTMHHIAGVYNGNSSQSSPLLHPLHRFHPCIHMNFTVSKVESAGHGKLCLEWEETDRTTSF